MSEKLSPPPISSRLTDGNGNITRPWADWFQQMVKRLNRGESGWFDDGAEFRVAVTNGIISSIDDSTAGGHS